jgi:molybdate transport system regulatory protein
MPAQVTLRLDFEGPRRLGHGKISLLESIRSNGSISAAGREHGMSYRRAWLLVDELNRMFREPIVATKGGGRNGGGAALTEMGERVVTLYRSAERKMARSAKAEIEKIEQSLAPAPGEPA